MELTDKDIRFLTIMNETRLSDGRLFGRYSEEVNKVFPFTPLELEAAVKKLLSMNLLSQMKLDRNETLYFHTEKVFKIALDRKLKQIKH